MRSEPKVGPFLLNSLVQLDLWKQRRVHQSSRVPVNPSNAARLF
jgi:hypothetical protein